MKRYNEHDLEKVLSGDVLYMAIEKSGSEQLNQQSCDCNRLMIVMADKILGVEHEEHGEDGTIGFERISSFSKEIYSLRISAPSDGIFRFVKVFYQEDGAVDGIKYRFGDRYLFIFASEYNLIVTKSIMDLTEEDDTPVPIYDPSILFDNVLLSSGYNLDQKRHETSTIVYINLDYYS